jgi:hypothetical protein
MQHHLEFQIVTPRTLVDFKGSTLVLPDVRVLNESESAFLKEYVKSGKTLIITGEDRTQSLSGEGVIRFPKGPGKDYYSQLQSEMAESTSEREPQFLASLKSSTPVSVAASPLIATSIAKVDGNIHVFFANFAGLQGGVNPVQTPQQGATVTVSGAKPGHAFFLPFLGDVQPLHGTADSAGITYKLPTIEKGAVFWYEP